jgi:predicted O-methyltransferase YrrM
MLRKVGVFPVNDVFYEPLFNPTVLKRLLEEERPLPGVDLRPDQQRALLAQMHCEQELRDFQWHIPGKGPHGYNLHNLFFDGGDADFLYQFLRLVKPRRVIEIGSGYSTRVAQTALEKNFAETGERAVHRCIEPYQAERLSGLQGVELIKVPVEDVPIDWSTELAAGDLLFIDSSHMIRPQGDVLKEYLEILPRLASGVYVQIHDIHTPRDYPAWWMEKEVRFWNEQYLLEALLSNTARYEVIGALNYLTHNYYEEIARVCPYITPETEPSSFYLRVR